MEVKELEWKDHLHKEIHKNTRRKGGTEECKKRSYLSSTKEQECVIGQGTTNEFEGGNSSSKNDSRSPLKQEKEYG